MVVYYWWWWCSLYKYMPFTMTSVSSQSSTSSSFVDIMRRCDGLCFQERRRHVTIRARIAVIKRPNSRDRTAPFGRSAYPSWSRISKAKWFCINRYCSWTKGGTSECDSQVCLGGAIVSSLPCCGPEFFWNADSLLSAALWSFLGS